MSNKNSFNRKGRNKTSRWQIMSFIIVVAFLIDQITKIFIKTSLDVGQSIPIIPGFFSLKYILNNGVAFGGFSGNWFFTYVIPIVMMGVFFYMIYKFYYKALYAYTLTFMIAGTLGNLFDRFTNNGYVIDFLTFNIFGYHFPSFNFADIFLVISILVIMGESIWSSRKKNNDKK